MIVIFHYFHCQGMWTSQATTGEKPPALSGHTLTMIDQNTALLFGGSDGTAKHNDSYVLNMDTWVCCMIYLQGTAIYTTSKVWIKGLYHYYSFCMQACLYTVPVVQLQLVYTCRCFQHVLFKGEKPRQLAFKP